MGTGEGGGGHGRTLTSIFIVGARKLWFTKVDCQLELESAMDLWTP